MCVATPAQFAEHFPAHPEQQDAAREGDADNAQKLGRGNGEDDSQQGRRRDAEQDRASPLLGGKPCRRHADDNRVIAGQYDVDEQHLTECNEFSIIAISLPFPAGTGGCLGL